MGKNKQIILLVIILLLTPAYTLVASPRTGYGYPKAQYKAKEGFTIISYAKNWDKEKKLEKIKDELLANTIAEEIKALKAVYIYPDSPEGVLGYTYLDIGRDSKANYTYGNNTYIEIFEGDSYKTIDEMAKVLSHEYGHHFTSYHLIKGEGRFFDSWDESAYGKYRDPKEYPKMTFQNEYGDDLYRWDIQEIAAEDYVQLFGSPRAKKSLRYLDIRDKISKGVKDNFSYRSAFNINPQENKEIPLAADVRGLENYWRSLARLPQVKEKDLEKPTLSLVMKKEIAKGYFQYRLEWDKIGESSNYEYTLISYPEGPYIFPYPIKTVRGEEEAYAIIGNGLKLDKKLGKSQLVLDDYRGQYVFKLYIKDEFNKIYSSQPLNIDFENPLIKNNGIFKDLDPKDWAYGPAATLVKNEIMEKPQDQFFHPLQEVSFKELEGLMDKLVKRELGESSVGFFDLLLEKNFIKETTIENLKNKDFITREDAAYLAYKYIKVTNKYKGIKIQPTKFKDSKKIFRKDPIGYLETKGIIRGYNNYYYPQNNISRQELASIIAELLTD